MAFKDKYTGKKSNMSYFCILPFFGFKTDTGFESRTRGVYVRDSEARSGQRKVYGSESYEVSILYRKSMPSGKELELEDKFIQAVSSKYQKRAFLDGYFNALQTSPIETSLPKFYESSVGARIKLVPKFLRWIPIALTVVWLALYNILFPIFKQKFGYDLGSVLFVFPVPLLIWLIYAVVKNVLEDANYRSYQKQKNTQPAYNSLTREQKENVRQQYFAQMKRLYGPEAGAILEEYAILKGYDRI